MSDENLVGIGNPVTEVMPMGAVDAQGNAVTLNLDPDGNLKTVISANVTIENANIDIAVSANPSDGDKVADSLVAAGTTDGLFPGAGPNITSKPFTVVQIDGDKHAPVVVARNSDNAELASEQTLAEVRDALVGDEASGNVLFDDTFNRGTTASLDSYSETNKKWLVEEPDLVISLANNIPYVSTPGSDVSNGVALREIGKKDFFVEFTLTAQMLVIENAPAVLKAIDYKNSIEVWADGNNGPGQNAFALWGYVNGVYVSEVVTKCVASVPGQKLGLEVTGTICKFYIDGVYFDTLDFSGIQGELLLQDATRCGISLKSIDLSGIDADGPVFTDFKVQAFKTDKPELHNTDVPSKAYAVPTREVDSTNPDIFKRISQADLALSPIIWDDFKRPDSNEVGNGWQVTEPGARIELKDNSPSLTNQGTDGGWNALLKEAYSPNGYVEFTATGQFLVENVEVALRMQDYKTGLSLSCQSDGSLRIYDIANDSNYYVTPFLSPDLNASPVFRKTPKVGILLDGDIAKFYVNRKLVHTVDLSTTGLSGNTYNNNANTKFGMLLYDVNQEQTGGPGKNFTDFLITRYAPEEPNTSLVKQSGNWLASIKNNVIFQDNFDVQDNDSILDSRMWEVEPDSTILVFNKYPYANSSAGQDMALVDARTPDAFIETTITQRLLDDDVELAFRVKNTTSYNDDSFLGFYFQDTGVGTYAIQFFDWDGGAVQISPDSFLFKVGAKLGVEFKGNVVTFYVDGKFIARYAITPGVDGFASTYEDRTKFGILLYGADASAPTFTDFVVKPYKQDVPSLVNAEPKESEYAVPVRQVGVNKVTSQDLGVIFSDKFDRPGGSSFTIGMSGGGELGWNTDDGSTISMGALGPYVEVNGGSDLITVDAKSKDVFVEFEITQRLVDDAIEVALRASDFNTNNPAFNAIYIALNTSNLSVNDWQNVGSCYTVPNSEYKVGAKLGIELKGSTLNFYLNGKFWDRVDLLEGGFTTNSISLYGNYFGFFLYGSDAASPNIKNFAIYKFAPSQSQEQEVVQKSIWQSGIKHDVLFQEDWNQGNGWDITAPMSGMKTWEVEPGSQILLNGNNPYPDSFDDIGMAVVDVGQHDCFIETTITQRLLDDEVELSLLVKDVSTFEDTSFVEVWFETGEGEVALLFYDWSNNYIGTVISNDFIVGAKFGVEILGNTLNTYVNGEFVGKVIIPPVSAGYTDFSGRTRHGINFYDNPDGSEPNFLDFVIKPFKQDLAKVTNKDLDGTEYAQAIKTPVPSSRMPYSLGIINISSDGDSVILNGVSGQSSLLYGITLIIEGSTTISIQDTDGDLFLPYTVTTAGSSIVLDPGSFPRFISALNEGLKITSSSAVNITGHFYYRQEVL